MLPSTTCTHQIFRPHGLYGKRETAHSITKYPRKTFLFSLNFLFKPLNKLRATVTKGQTVPGGGGVAPTIHFFVNRDKFGVPYFHLFVTRFYETSNVY